VDRDNPQETPERGDCHEERRPRSFIESEHRPVKPGVAGSSPVGAAHGGFAIGTARGLLTRRGRELAWAFDSPTLRSTPSRPEWYGYRSDEADAGGLAVTAWFGPTVTV
jgi:hypothetical protein